MQYHILAASEQNPYFDHHKVKPHSTRPQRHFCDKFASPRQQHTHQTLASSKSNRVIPSRLTASVDLKKRISKQNISVSPVRQQSRSRLARYKNNVITITSVELERIQQILTSPAVSLKKLKSTEYSLFLKNQSVPNLPPMNRPGKSLLAGTSKYASIKRRNLDCRTYI